MGQWLIKFCDHPFWPDHTLIFIGQWNWADIKYNFKESKMFIRTVQVYFFGIKVFIASKIYKVKNSIKSTAF